MINDKWEKITSYLIHDNGARPYLVTFGDKNVIIYKNDDGNFKVMNIIVRDIHQREKNSLTVIQLTDKNVYFMIDKKYIDIDKLPKDVTKNLETAYDYFYTLMFRL